MAKLKNQYYHEAICKSCGKSFDFHWDTDKTDTIDIGEFLSNEPDMDLDKLTPDQLRDYNTGVMCIHKNYTENCESCDMQISSTINKKRKRIEVLEESKRELEEEIALYVKVQERLKKEIEAEGTVNTIY